MFFTYNLLLKSKEYQKQVFHNVLRPQGCLASSDTRQICDQSAILGGHAPVYSVIRHRKCRVAMPTSSTQGICATQPSMQMRDTNVAELNAPTTVPDALKGPAQQSACPT